MKIEEAEAYRTSICNHSRGVITVAYDVLWGGGNSAATWRASLSLEETRKYVLAFHCLTIAEQWSKESDKETKESIFARAYKFLDACWTLPTTEDEDARFYRGELREIQDDMGTAKARIEARSAAIMGAAGGAAAMLHGYIEEQKKKLLTDESHEAHPHH